jgi:hypothetical protein
MMAKQYGDKVNVLINELCLGTSKPVDDVASKIGQKKKSQGNVDKNAASKTQISDANYGVFRNPISLKLIAIPT